MDYPDKIKVTDSKIIAFDKLNQIIDAGIEVNGNIRLTPGNIIQPVNDSVDIINTTIILSPCGVRINGDTIASSTFWLTTDPEGKNVVYGPYTESGNTHSLNMAEVLVNTPYYVWAYQTSNMGFNSSTFGGNRFNLPEIKINPPVITSPTNGATDLTDITVTMEYPTVEEGGTPDHTKTQVELISNDMVVDTFTVESKIPSVPIVTEPNTTYTIRARFYDDTRGWSDWSDTVNFTTKNIFINPPVITSPTNGATDLANVTVVMNPPIVEEGGTPNHTKTEIEVTKGIDTVSVVSVTENLLNVSITTDPNSSYSIRARFYDSVRGWSDWSESVSFTTPNISIDAPIITSPTDGVTDLSDVTVTMSAPVVEPGGTPNHTQTQVELSSGGSIVDIVTVTSDLLNVPLTLDFGITYSIRARFYDSVRGWSDWSDPVGFTMMSVFINAPVITSPINGQDVKSFESDVPILITINPPVVEEGGTPDHLVTMLETNVDDVSETTNYAENLLALNFRAKNLTSYSIRVKFFDEIRGWSEWSESISFTVSQAESGSRIDGGIAIGPYSFADGQTGYLVVAPGSERTTSPAWGLYDLNIPELDDVAYATSDDTDVNTGIYNTNILTSDTYNTLNDGNGSVGAPIAEYCDNLNFEGFSDYFLPNRQEVLFIVQNASLIDNNDDTIGIKIINNDFKYLSSSSRYSTKYFNMIKVNEKSAWIGTRNLDNTYLTIPCRRILI